MSSLFSRVLFSRVNGGSLVWPKRRVRFHPPPPLQPWSGKNPIPCLGHEVYGLRGLSTSTPPPVALRVPPLYFLKWLHFVASAAGAAAVGGVRYVDRDAEQSP